MYESFYHLKEKPFDLHPDPDYLFMSEGHDNAYTHLEYAISENKGFVVITGEIGSGKTTLINYFLHKIQQDVLVGLINNTHAPLSQLAKMICQEFELEIDGLNKLEMLNVFHEFLLQQFGLKKRVVLIIDEAQNLSAKAIEEIRLISNLETEKNHLIQIILVGQPELKLNLQKKELEQFAQRVTVYCHLGGLKQDEAEKYIHFRLKTAGAQNPDIFDQNAIKAIYEFARGIPRLMNTICDTALVYGFAETQETITRKVIEDVIQAREAGAVFQDASQEHEAVSTKPQTKAVVSRQLSQKLKNMEQRISLLENMVESMSQNLNRISKQKDERDTVVLELFKLLKSSMENRINALIKFGQYRKKIESANGSTPPEIPPENPPFLLRFKKKKVK